MAYNLYYTISFTNNLFQVVTINLYKDASAPVSVGTYECTGVQREQAADGGETGFTKYGTLISTSLSLGIWIPEVDTNANPVTWETFVTSSHTQWKVIADIDGSFYFHGFLTPDEGNALFQDAPYEILLRATDGLKLLEKQELTKYDGTRFLTYNRDLIIAFIVACLEKTKLELPIRIYCNYFHNSILNRGNALQHDMFNQVEVSRRTWLKDVNSFESCYEVLRRIFTQFCTVEYWNGMWQITCIAEKQYLPVSLYYTDYAKDGTGATGTLVSENHAQVGKSVDIVPIRTSQFISSRYALKSAKHFYNYVIPEDLVVNQNLQQLGSFIAPLSGSGYNAYQLVGWTQYQGDPTALTTYAGSKNAYIKVEVDAFGTQTDRYYVIEADTGIATAMGHEIRHDNGDFNVRKDDKMVISITARLNADQSGSDPIFLGRVALLIQGSSGSSASDWYSLNPNGSWVNNPFANFAQTTETEDTSLWVTYETETNTFPSNGTLYIFCGSGGVDNLGSSNFKDLKITYTALIRGARFNMKGDYWFTSQNAIFPDKLEEEMFISDSPVPIVKGGLWWNNQLLDPSWRRYPATETKHFKELINIGRYNHSYRRMYAIDGEFEGLFYSPENDQLNKQPIGFHKRYRFVDMSPTRDFILVPPVTMDLMKGEFKGTFVEAIKDGADGTQTGDSHEFNYIF